MKVPHNTAIAEIAPVRLFAGALKNPPGESPTARNTRVAPACEARNVFGDPWATRKCCARDRGAQRACCARVSICEDASFRRFAFDQEKTSMNG